MSGGKVSGSRSNFTIPQVGEKRAGAGRGAIQIAEPVVERPGQS